MERLIRLECEGCGTVFLEYYMKRCPACGGEDVHCHDTKSNKGVVS